MSTPLTNFDTRYAFIGLHFVYLFDYKLSEEQVKNGLQKALHYYPQLTGVLQECKNKTSKCAKLEIKHGKPSDVQLVVSEYKGPDASNYKQWGKADSNGILSDYDNKLLMQFVDRQETGYPYKLGTPVFKAKLTHVNDCSVLGVSINHSIADAESFFYFMRAWAQFSVLPEEKVEKKYKQPNHQREKVMKVSKDYKERVIPKDKLIMHGMYYDLDKVPPPKQGKNITLLSIEFSEQDIKKLKEDAFNGKAKDKLKIVSTNDVICCHMWKLLAMLRTGEDRKDDTIFPVFIIYNFRKIWEGIGDNYFGNAVTYLILEATKKELVESDLSELVFRMRDAVQKFSVQDVQDAIDVLERNVTPLPKTPLDPTNGFTVTNWSKFDILDVDFGKGKPFRLYCPVEGAALWSSRIVSNDIGGVSFIIYLDDEVLGKVNALEKMKVLKSTMAYQAIPKMF